MKNLFDQIKFIDKKLIVLFGFKGITDYDHIISLTDTDTIKLDMGKLNELIPEFRKIFHSKNFNLHKTEYKIKTEIQAVCLLKTCLEITSIPFDVSIKKNKRSLRLISKNNILDDYIKSLKMSEKRTLCEKLEIVDTEIIAKTDEKINDVKPATEQVIQGIYSFVKDTTGQKEMPKKEIITKEMLNQSVKTTSQYILSLDLNNIKKKTYSCIPSLVIDLKEYEMGDKILQHCVVSIKSKLFNGKPILSQEFINELLSEINYKLIIGGQEIYDDNFNNGQDIIISNIFIPIKYLTLHRVQFILQNMDKINNYLDMLEMELNIVHVKFYTEIENKLNNNNFIYQKIEHHGLFNILRISAGMAGNAYGSYLNKDEFEYLENGVSSKPKYLNRYNLDTELEKIENKPHNCLTIPELNGLELLKYDDKFLKFMENGYTAFKYDYITWKETKEIPIDFLTYYRQIKDNESFIHCYDIPIDGLNRSISDICIKFFDFNYKTLCVGSKPSNINNREDIEIEFIDAFSCKKVIDLVNGYTIHSYSENKNIIDNIINSNMKPIYGINYIRIKINSNIAEIPIKGKKNININIRYYYWNEKHHSNIMKS